MSNDVVKVVQGKKRRRASTLFPVVLYDVLSDEDDPTLISWSPCGTMFDIKNVRLFKEKVIPKHFTCKNFSAAF